MTATRDRKERRGQRPLQAYLPQIGRPPLLTREGEVAIAKRAEAGKLTVLAAIDRGADARCHPSRSIANPDWAASPWRRRARRTQMVFVTVLVYVLDANEARRMAKSRGAT